HRYRRGGLRRAARPAAARALAYAPVEQDVTSGLRANVLDFWHGFKTTLSSRPFLKLCAATFLVFNGFILISSFQFYVIIYYVFGGDQIAPAPSTPAGGTLGAASTFAADLPGHPAGHAPSANAGAFVVSTAISMVGYGLKWFAYDPGAPWLILLPAPLMAFGLGGLFTLMPSTIADVVDLDELETRQRRGGMYGSIFWWVVKLGRPSRWREAGCCSTSRDSTSSWRGSSPRLPSR
ncbi:MAG: MFS transporter, partial [Planctomycetes bacterium]|nr:MFS transporter [Planctomycetota bacterium]